jgi:hypothetical protein
VFSVVKVKGIFCDTLVKKCKITVLKKNKKNKKDINRNKITDFNAGIIIESLFQFKQKSILK